MKQTASGELPVIQHTYDLILWFVPILNRLPRDHKFLLGDRLIAGLYDLLEGLIVARYAPRGEKPALLAGLNRKLDVLRYQNRLLHDFALTKLDRYEYAARAFQAIGSELGAWLKARDTPSVPGKA